MAVIDTIDHISTYCDSWCERCPFTSRCSAYAVRIATTMCDGDFAAGLELVLGPFPKPNGEKEADDDVPDWAEMEEPTEAELAEAASEWQQRKERLNDLPVSRLAWKVSWRAHAWLEAHAEQWRTSVPMLAEAIRVATWDCFLVTAKVRRALSGKDHFLRGDDVDDDPVQNDWNGSAKVALISLARSAEAWSVIAGITAEPEAAQIEAELRTLRDDVERTFPDAWRFVRPGFDTHL
jgi:hypothetical protein